LSTFTRILGLFGDMNVWVSTWDAGSGIGCRFRRVQRESNEAGKSYTYPKSRHPVFGSHSHFTSK
jgi:hypothetical protein